MIDAPKYLLMKRGLYEAPGHHGYTGIKEKAGRFHRDEASPDHGVTAVHEDYAPDYAPACFDDVKVKHLEERVSRLQAQILGLGATPVC